jgi:hypothetical protein
MQEQQLLHRPVMLRLLLRLLLLPLLVLLLLQQQLEQQQQQQQQSPLPDQHPSCHLLQLLRLQLDPLHLHHYPDLLLPLLLAQL